MDTHYLQKPWENNETMDTQIPAPSHLETMDTQILAPSHLGHGCAWALAHQSAGVYSQWMSLYNQIGFGETLPTVDV
jgi:hypothetical protein